MAKEIERKEEKDFIICDRDGEPVGLAIDHPRPWDEGERVRSLYPGQPEREDTYVDTIPVCSGLSGEGVSGEKTDASTGNAAVGKGSAEDEENTVLVPVFITARDYIYRRYRLMMYAFMNGLLRQGRLAGILGFDIRDRILNRNSFKPGFISFWRIDRSSFYADVSVRLILDTARGRKEWRGILVLQCGFDGEGLACRALELVKDPRRKDDGLIPLSPYLVPYLRNREVDRVSERILGKYMPEAADDPGAGDAAELARRMGLKVVCLPVDDHKGIPSILFWEDGRLPVRDKRRIGQAEPESVMIPKNTIVVNTNDIREEYSGFHIFHECIHYELHYMACRLQKQASNDIQEVEFRKVKPERGETIADPVHFMENQANRGAYGLMMPEGPARRMIREECRKAGDCRHAGEMFHTAGKRMACKLLLPDFRVRARMIQLGYNQAKGALNYADKIPVEPFAFNPEAWRDDRHTFVIDRELTEYLMRKNEDFRRMIAGGSYIYADGHVVRNDPRCVCSRRDRLYLTDWANAHVDECCLRFVRRYVQQRNGRYSYGRIYYDADYIRQTFFYLQDIMVQEGIDEIDARYRYRQEFPGTFREAVNMLRKKKGISMESLSEKLDTSEKTLKRWLDEPGRFGGADLIVTLALILELPDWISRMLFKRAHIQLDEDDRRHQALEHILRVQTSDGIKAANDYLRKMKLAPLSL